MKKVTISVFLSMTDEDWDLNMKERRENMAWADPEQEEMRDLEREMAWVLQGHTASYIRDYEFNGAEANIEIGS